MEEPSAVRVVENHGHTSRSSARQGEDRSIERANPDRGTLETADVRRW
jgi:hypothetical protein